mgnify:FL=1
MLIKQVRRGADSAKIYSVSFSSNAQWLALSSDKGTVHVFSLKAPTSGSEPKHDGRSLSGLHNGSGTSVSGSPPSTSANNPSSTLSFMKGMV